MAQAYESLSDLFEHGTLPFVGRAAELRLIHDFWRSTFHAERLRALVISGEAGSGKSRLLEAALPPVAAQGGVVAHIKLYHDGSAAIAPMVIEALRPTSFFQHVARSAGGSPLSTAAHALRRTARLRPLLLVIEDIQFLEGEGLQELSQLLEMLADEPISAIFVTRPVKQGARGVIERHLVDELTLSGLGHEEIAALWEIIMERPPSETMVEQLYTVTLGNPLALRSALREATREQYADEKEGSRGWITGEALRYSLERRVELLAEGMVAHLSEREMHAAAMLASLGEVFAREAAEAVLDGAAEALALMEQRGIISTLVHPAMPVNGLHTRFPLFVFSHSLIHKYLVGHDTLAPRRLVELIGAGAPLYSLLPFQLLLGYRPEELPILDGEELLAFEARIGPAVSSLADGSDWRLAITVWRVLERMFEVARPGLTPRERLMVEREVCHNRLQIFARENYSEEYERTVARFLELTAAPANEREGRLRLCALDNFMALEHVIGRGNVEFVWEEAEKVIEAIPEVIASRRYVLFLSALASYVLAVRITTKHGRGMVARIEEKLEAIMRSPIAGEELRRFAWQKLSPLFLRSFNTREELEGRMQLRAELARRVSVGDWFFIMEERALLETTGEIDELLKSFDRWYHRVMAHGLHRTARSLMLTHYRALALAGGDRRELERKSLDLLDNPVPLPVPNRNLFARAFALTALLCDDAAWAARLFEQFPAARALAAPAVLVVMALDGGDDERLREMIAIANARRGEETPGEAMPETDLVALAALLLDPDAGEEAIRPHVEAIAAAPVLRIVDVLRAAAMAALVAEIARRRDPHLAVAMAPLCKRLLLEALEWCAAHGLPPVIGMLLDRHGDLLSPRERTSWSARLAAAAAERSRLFANGPGRFPLRLSVIGTIAVAKHDTEPHRPRGERMRVLLALMVAGAITARPLAQEEFAAIATGIEGDPEAARLRLTHMIYRLRETIGANAVVTAGTPRLNPEIVEIDLVDAWRAIERSAAALAEGMLARAVHALNEALDIVDGEVIFPTLYDGFFAALRADIEGRLQEMVTSVAARLAEEGDHEGSRALLRRGLVTMTDD